MAPTSSPPSSELSTPHLVIVPLSVDHADALFEGFVDPRVYPFIPETPPETPEAYRAEVRRLVEGPPPPDMDLALNWAVWDTEVATWIGTLQASRFKDGTVWIGYKLAPVGWGRGLATEAVRWLVHLLHHNYGAEQVLASVDSRHLASLRVLEKVGFQRLRSEVSSLHDQVTQDQILGWTAPTSP